MRHLVPRLGLPTAMAIAMATAMTPGLVGASECPPAIFWPDPTWTEQPTNGSAVEAMTDYAFTLVGRDEERRGIRTDGVVIVHRGQIIYENYGRGFDRDNPHLTWSVSKSMLDAMFGAAVYQGYLDPLDSVCDHYDAVNECAMTPADLRAMGSGLDWNEGYEDEPYHLSSVIAMLYGLGALDMAAFVGRHRSQAPPGTLYRYSSGDSVLLAAVVAGSLPQALQQTYPHDFIFGPIGMRSAIFERDRAGTVVGSSYAYATPRDMARFGYLYLHDGCWAGERLLPEGWVEQSRAVNPVFLVEASFEWSRDGDAVPGSHWWTNHAIPDLGITSVWPDVPADAYAASGHWGQSITVIPSEELVVVRTADDREYRVLDRNRFLSLAIAIAREAE